MDIGEILVNFSRLTYDQKSLISPEFWFGPLRGVGY